ncbi:uncharacterized protein GGS22DRAFT_145502 [Annulohypoxylon maeteangense]|uniref:uncharacterized protein n=1 Tax=Annulohypoxylon maeteangense TaxID=1927788 RepID=UPI00200840FD|nr:uncharacterized protein GGS22DRAFT_145502 [Annulohypoxylon maeteangense]KAI0884665.1 hypothetical protein GGS22DRAFT_145502 [Annulohypoxylon maeteangense]
MGKIAKAIQPKHKETQSPWLQEFIDNATSVPLPLLPKTLATFPSRWPFPRGDLYHWIPLLNRFDDVLESFCSTYKLNEGPQTRDIGCDVLRSSSVGDQEKANEPQDFSELGYGKDGDVQLVVAILKFTQMLLDHCGNRSMYASSSHLNDLLNSTDFTIVCATLRVGAELAQRYQASVKRIHGMTTRQLHTTLLTNHYNIDLDRVQQLSQPFVKTPLSKPLEPTLLSTPASISKSKDKSYGGGSKNVATMYANDLCALAKADSIENSRWNGWGDVKLTYYPTSDAPQGSAQQSLPDRGANLNAPSTPTPLRRSSTSAASQSTPRAGRQGASEESPGSASRSPAVGRDESSPPGQKSLEISHASVSSSSIYQLLARAPADLPKDAKYELLNRLRVAKALTGSVESRQQALKARLLAIQNLAYIHIEPTFIERVLRQDNDEPRRFQLVYQLAELIHPAADGAAVVPIDLQSIAFSLLEAISNFHHKLPDVFSALNATVNHGVLLYVIRKAVAEMKKDDSGEQYSEQDEWRDTLISLTLHITMSMANNTSRSMPEIISAGLLDIIVEILNLRSNIAERTYGTLVAFLDSLVYNVQNSFQTLINADGLEAVTNLVTHEVELAGKLVSEGKGTPVTHRSQVVDYEIPYCQQQNLKHLLKFIHHLMSNAFAFGGNTDRLLRNLVDKSALLRSIREIIENMSKFGSLVWTNAVVILSDFLNNDPTSFAAISEAGLVQSYLQALTGRPVPTAALGGVDSAQEGNRDDSPESPSDGPTPDLLEPDSRSHPPLQEELEAPRDGPLARGILPNSEPITIVPTVLNAISLNNLGMKMVVASRAFDSYFEIFESPEHVRVMATDDNVAQNVGGNFDELARHHPSLRPAIANAVLDMIARVAHLARVKARDAQWGAKLLVKDSNGQDVIADEGLLSEPRVAPSDKGKGKAVAPVDGADIEMMDASAQLIESAESAVGSASIDSSSITPYIYALSNFLTQYISNNNLKMNLINNGGIELLLDLTTSPSLPHDFGDSVASRSIQSVVAQLVETSPIIGLPSLLKRTQAAIDVLQPVTQYRDEGSFFAPFLSDDAVPTGQPDDYSSRLSRGTEWAKALLNTQSLIKTLYQCFPYSQRANTVNLHSVNVFDYYSRLIKSLGPLLRTAVLEEAEISNSVPDNWSTRKQGQTTDQQSSSTNGVTSNADNTAAVPEPEDSSLPDVLSSANLWLAAATTGSIGDGPSQSEQSGPRYQNYRTLRLLLHSLMPATFPLFQTVGKALLPRRERDQYLRVRHLQLAEDLAQTILAQFELPDRERSSKDFHYWIIILHAVHEMLVNRTIETRSDRQSPTQIIAPVLIAFKKHGGLELLNTMLRTFKEEICKEHKDGEDSSMSRLAVIGMKKILDLYTMAVNGKIITDSMSQINILPRNLGSSDRRADSQVAPNLVIELRMSILPVMRELWDSPLVEKGSAHILAKIISILKFISFADSESNAYRRMDKNAPPSYLQPAPLRFSWTTVEDDTREVVGEAACDEDLAHEGLYRANNNRHTAAEYCKAHKSGLAGTRNPIPEEDSPENADEESAPTAERTQASSGDDAMVLDFPADLPPGLLLEEDILDELREATMSRDAASGDENAVTSSTTPAQGPSTGASTETDLAKKTAVAKEDLDEERAKLRVNLIERCLDVIRAHPDSTYEVSELVSSIILRTTSDEPSSRQEIGETLANALISFVGDDMKLNGRSIAAYAHLLSLLLQEKAFFRATVDILKVNVTDFMRFLELPTSQASEELPPWIPYILLVFEILLSDDEQPGEIKWKLPSSEDDQIEELQWSPKDLIVKDGNRQTLLGSVLDILPRIGKDESLAVSVLRILVILTRDRSIARLVGEKKNLQRLFVTAKQLSGAGSVRLRDTRITSNILTILRHVVEDEEVIKQVMRSEIRAYFAGGRNTARPLDPSGFTRTFSQIALRDPRLFVEVSNETVKLSRWTPPESNIGRGQTIILKEPKPDMPKDDVAPAVRATEDLTIQDVKPSTEGEDKHMTDASKPQTQDSKRPVVENPDGVVHFLLCELLNYKEVDDKELPPPAKDSKKEDDQEPADASGASDSESTPADSKEKKAKPSFKAEDHPIFIYRCFLLHCLTELLQSYNRTKVEFINFKRSAPLFANTPIKPRSTVLNYLLNDLLFTTHVETTLDSLVHKKKYATSIQTQNLLVALVSKTGEKPIDQGRDKYDYDDEPDLLFVRKFVLDTILRAYKDAATTSEPFDSRYTRMLALAEVMHLMMGEKDKEPPVPSRGGQDPFERSQAQLRRLMYEKGYLAALTASIADIDLAFPPVKRTIKYILRVLRILTSTAIHLSHSNIIPNVPTQENMDEETFSGSSLSDIDDDREETPDLYRNSALGMLEPGRDRDGDYSEDSDDDDDEEMYDDEYDDDMGYESEDREEDVSERDEEEELEGMGPIEGLSGDHGVIEVTMDDDDDDMDEDDDEDGSDEDELESDDMDDNDDRIEIIDDEGNPLEDDGGSGWEDDTDEDEEDDDGEEVDYEAAEQDIEEEAAAHLEDVAALRFGNIMRAIEEDEFEPPDDLHGRYMEDDDDDDEDEEEEDDMDDEYAYEDAFPNDAPPRDAGPSSLGWDTLVVEPHGGILGHHNRQRHGTRSPFPPIPFMMGSRDPISNFGDPRGFGRNRHDQRPTGNEDGLNPLLRRANDASRDGSSRTSNLGNLVRLGFPGGLFGGSNLDSPMSFINDLVASLPASLSRNGHAFHFQITQGRGDVHDMQFPFGIQIRESRSENRRETYQEPIQATSFTTDTTVARWTEEVKMIFGLQHTEKSHRLIPAILSHLVPPAIQHEKELKAKEAERQRQQEEERKKREEEERKLREAKEAEEKAAQEKREAEERERAAAESAAQTQSDTAAHKDDEGDHIEPEAMEGVETSDDAAVPSENEQVGSQPRAYTTIRGEQVDITELGIDPDYLEALPEEFREEVIAQTVSTRRAQAREAPGGAGEQTEVFQEFLDALPDELRLEIVQQERAEQRRREREEIRRTTAAPGQAAEAQDMDPATILMTFPPALREQVLMDQGPELMSSLTPDLAAQTRRLIRANPIVHHEHLVSNTNRRTEGAPATAPADGDKPPRKTVVQMLDKPGVYTLLRLMFINMKGGSLETSLKFLFKDVCENRQTRFEVVSNLLKILQEGSTDVDAVERSFAALSIKAKQPKDIDNKAQTPQSLKRTFTNISNTNPIQASSETSPLLIVQQCLDLLCYLADQNVHVPSLFLTEHDGVSAAAIKRSLSRKGKSKDMKANKYAINSLLALLDRDLVMESSSIMDSLSQLLSRVTGPLLALDRKQKEASEAIKNLDAQPTNTADPAGTTALADLNNTDAAQSGSANTAEQTAEQPASTPTEAAENAPSGISAAEAESVKALEKQAIMKRIKQLHPPIIPVHNLTLIIKIFVARECSSKTFKETLSTIKNLSVIPGAMLVFGEELARQAQLLSEKIVVHLDDLLPHIQNAASGTEIQGVALAKFSPGASDQNKLLRVLTALDHLFAQKKSDTTEGSESDETTKQDLLATLYRNTTFNALWEKLSACLSAIRQRESLLNVATILLPLIEALMVVCKDETLTQGQASKDMVLSSPQPESRLAGLFFTFTEEHRRILNELVRNNPSLMKGTFSHLVKNPKVLEFDNKRNWFNRSVHNKQQVSQRPHPMLQLQVRREHVFHDSFKSLYFKSGEEMKFGKLSIRFHGEEGVDAGGVTREWFQVLARQMFDANYALFVPVSSDRTTFHPNKLSGINDEHLMFFKFIGRVIGKALYEGRLLDCYFSRAVYKRILGKPVSVKDMESFDPDYYKSLSWMLNNDITDIITETFSVEDDEFGLTKIHDLIDNGRNVPVTEENKHDYVRLVVEHKLLTSVKVQMENFLKGFHEIIPAELISIFNEQELELLISGLPDVDIDDWKSNTEYHNYSPSSPQIQWFWRAVRSFDKEERAKLLQFVTGTSKVPLNGFKELEGMNGVNRFNIHRDYGNKDRLPSSHTCFNQLDLPEYESYDALRRQIIKAITTGSDYFGFA